MAESKAPVQSPVAAKVQAMSSEEDVLVTLDFSRGKKQSPTDAVPAPGTPKMATPVKRPVSADLPRKALASDPHDCNETCALVPHLDPHYSALSSLCRWRVIADGLGATFR